ncbi:hypothetical protein QJS10_CPB04g01230 [Acorus calamus]|uniref:Uncharacterized protein n=1 Tax=Acorus calamus TaxID=4465 RepID=A0AAV9EWY5_ACOCL|nr:hypothetical protein QJS10_CPB04g01230 [Acorus calamus]
MREFEEKESRVRSTPGEDEEHLKVIEKQKKAISDMEDDASVHEITQKSAMDAEITCLKEEIIEKDNIIA